MVAENETQNTKFKLLGNKTIDINFLSEVFKKKYFFFIKHFLLFIKV